MARFTIDGKTHDIDVRKLGLHEAMAVENATGMSMDDLGKGLVAGRVTAMAAYIWIILKFRCHEDVTWEQIESGERYVDVATMTVEDTPDPTAAAEAAPAATTSTEGESATSPPSPTSAT